MLLCNDCDIGKYTRPVSRQQLSKHIPVARQQILNNATSWTTTVQELFSTRSVPRGYKRDEVWSLVDSKFCMGVCEERTSACEAEESPLLEAIAREQLVKTQQAGKGLVGAMGFVNCRDYGWRCNCL
jgi:hypothetical protein